MKVFSIIVAICFIYYINCETETHCEYDLDKDTYRYNYDISPKSANDCKDRLTESNKKDGDKCCYRYGSKKQNEGECFKLNKYEYNNFGKYMKVIELQREIYKDMPKESSEEGEDIGTLHIDCHSGYIKIGLISLLLILF